MDFVKLEDWYKNIGTPQRTSLAEFSSTVYRLVRRRVVLKARQVYAVLAQFIKAWGNLFNTAHISAVLTQRQEKIKQFYLALLQRYQRVRHRQQAIELATLKELEELLQCAAKTVDPAFLEINSIPPPPATYKPPVFQVIRRYGLAVIGGGIVLVTSVVIITPPFLDWLVNFSLSQPQIYLTVGEQDLPNEREITAILPADWIKAEAQCAQTPSSVWANLVTVEIENRFFALLGEEKLHQEETPAIAEVAIENPALPVGENQKTVIPPKTSSGRQQQTVKAQPIPRKQRQAEVKAPPKNSPKPSVAATKKTAPVPKAAACLTCNCSDLLRQLSIGVKPLTASQRAFFQSRCH